MAEAIVAQINSKGIEMCRRYRATSNSITVDRVPNSIAWTALSMLGMLTDGTSEEGIRVSTAIIEKIRAVAHPTGMESIKFRSLRFMGAKVRIFILKMYVVINTLR